MDAQHSTPETGLFTIDDMVLLLNDAASDLARYRRKARYAGKLFPPEALPLFISQYVEGAASVRLEAAFRLRMYLFTGKAWHQTLGDKSPLLPPWAEPHARRIFSNTAA